MVTLSTSGHHRFLRLLLVILLLLGLALSHNQPEPQPPESHCGPPPQDDDLQVIPSQNGGSGEEGGGYTFIALGVDNVVKLSEYMIQCPSVRPSHLMLSDVSMKHTARNSTFLRPFWADDDDSQEFAARVSNQFLQSVSTILHESSPTLQSFVYLPYLPVSKYSENVNIFNRTYPRLTALTLRISYPSPLLSQLLAIPSPNRLTMTTTTTTIPSTLTHLHLIDGRDVPTFGTLQSKFPGLSHLRFTGARSVYYGVPPDVNPFKQSEGLWSSIKYVIFPRLPPTTMKLVIVHPGFSPALDDDPGWCGTPMVEYEQMFELITPRTGVSMSLPIKEDFEKYNHVFAKYPLSRAKGDFLEWVERGGEGGESDVGAWRKPKVFSEEDKWWRVEWDKRDAQEL